MLISDEFKYIFEYEYLTRLEYNYICIFETTQLLHYEKLNV